MLGQMSEASSSRQNKQKIFTNLCPEECGFLFYLKYYIPQS